MAFDMMAMSTKLKQGKVGDLVRAIKKICRLEDIQSYMTFPELDKMKELKMVVFTNASLGNINEGTGSTGAFIIWVMDKTGHCCPVAWDAHKIKRVVRSTLAAEMLSPEQGVYYRQMLEDILGIKSKSIQNEKVGRKTLRN